MKLLIFELAALTLVALVVMAVVFRSAAARDLLRFGKRLLWAYVAMVVILAAIRLWGEWN